MGKLATTKQKSPIPTSPFPITPCGSWVKKIKGKLYYFGTDADAALSKYRETRDDLQAGRKPRTATDTLTIRNLVNRFLTTKKGLLDTGELSPRTFRGYYDTCENLVGVRVVPPYTSIIATLHRYELCSKSLQPSQISA